MTQLTHFTQNRRGPRQLVGDAWALYRFMRETRDIGAQPLYSKSVALLGGLDFLGLGMPLRTNAPAASKSPSDISGPPKIRSRSSACCGSKSTSRARTLRTFSSSVVY